MNIVKDACFINYLWKSAYILKNSFLGETLFKSSEIFVDTSLVEVFLWAKFQVKIRKYNFAGQLGPSGKKQFADARISVDSHGYRWTLVGRYKFFIIANNFLLQIQQEE